MKLVDRGVFSYDDGNVKARVITPAVVDEAVELFGVALLQKIMERNEEIGDYVHTFAPNPRTGRGYWLISFPTHDLERSAQELHLWVLGMLPDGGTIVMSANELDLMVLRKVFDQPVLFNEETEPRSIGDRFVVTT